MSGTCEVLMLGIGNILWADEGFGVRVVETLDGRYRFAPGVEIVDGGTQGLYLLDRVAAARRLILFDAVDFALPPATLEVVVDEAVPAYLGARKMSMHQSGFQEVLACARLSGWTPEHMVLIGVQPEVLADYGASLSDSVRTRIDEAVEIALAYLREWRIEFSPRADTAGDQGVVPAGVSLAAYERGERGRVR